MSSLPDSMRECHVCGLLFGGGDRCPECNAIFASTVETEQDESLPAGPLPGTSSLTDILSEVEGLSGPSSSDSDSRTNLPFTLGGARSSPKVQLLFGAGTRSDLSMDRIEEEPLKTEESIQEPEETNNIIPEDEIQELNSEITPEFENKTQVEEIVEQNPQDEILLTSRVIPSVQPIESVESEDVVFHDFSDESNFSEVEVDFDNLVDPAESAAAFDPIDGEVRLIQMPARALPLVSPFQEDEEELMISGFELMQNGNWGDAASVFMKLCEKRPGDAPAINNHGLCLLQSALVEFGEKPDEDPAELPFFHAAILTLRQAAMADRSSATILVNLATSLAAANRHETALPIFEAASSLESEPDSNRMNNHAVTLHAIGRDVDATNMLENAQSHSPEDTIIAENVRVLTISF
jgi:tetratricopeptide (TPR) repeat protein